MTGKSWKWKSPQWFISYFKGQTVSGKSWTARFPILDCTRFCLDCIIWLDCTLKLYYGERPKTVRPKYLCPRIWRPLKISPPKGEKHCPGDSCTIVKTFKQIGVTVAEILSDRKKINRLQRMTYTTKRIPTLRSSYNKFADRDDLLCRRKDRLQECLEVAGTDGKIVYRSRLTWRPSTASWSLNVRRDDPIAV